MENNENMFDYYAPLEFEKSKVTVDESDFAGATNSELCIIWAINFLENDTSLNDEIEGIKGTIRNENIWLHGADTLEDELMSIDNIKNLIAYYQWLIELKGK